MVPTLTPGLTGGAWGIQFDNAGASGPPSSAVDYRIDRNVFFSINAGSKNGAGTQSGAITKFGGATTTWSNVATLNTTLGYSRLLVRDRSTTVTGDLYLDNVSVVPEPSSALLALGGVGSLLALRLRRRAAA